MTDSKVSCLPDNIQFWQKTNFLESINSKSTDRFTAMHQIISLCLDLGIGTLPVYLGDSD